jgi:protease-4
MAAGAGNRAGPAGTGLLLDAPLVGANVEPLSDHLGKVGIGPRWRIGWIAANGAAIGRHVDQIQVWHKADRVGNADVKKMDLGSGAEGSYGVAANRERVHITETDSGSTGNDLGMVNTITGQEPHLVSRGTKLMGEDGDAAGAIAAHAADGAISVDVEHGKVGAGLARVLDQEDSIRSHAMVAVAEQASQPARLVRRERLTPAPIDTDEIISSAIQLHERNFHCGQPPTCKTLSSDTAKAQITGPADAVKEDFDAMLLRLLSMMVLVLGIATTSGCILIAPTGLLSGSPNYEEVQLKAGSGKKKILVLDIDGTITSGAQTPPGLFSSGDSTVNEVAEKLAKARTDRSIRAVVLRIDSPGGGVTASDVVYRLIRDYRRDTGVPVYASLLDMGTSGGYYVALGADEIYAHPTTITGSIGVIAIFPQFEDLGRKIGLYAEVIKSGRNKDLTGGLVNMSPEQREILQQMINELYGRFVDVVAEGRPNLERERIVELADGRIYTAREATEVGLINGVKYLDDVIEHVRQSIDAPKARTVLYRRTSNKAIESVYASSRRIDPNGASASNKTNVGLINVDASGLALGHHQPVFQYLWIP